MSNRRVLIGSVYQYAVPYAAPYTNKLHALMLSMCYCVECIPKRMGLRYDRCRSRLEQPHKRNDSSSSGNAQDAPPSQSRQRWEAHCIAEAVCRHWCGQAACAHQQKARICTKHRGEGKLKGSHPQRSGERHALPPREVQYVV